MSKPEKGPYCNEDGEWWVPVTVPYLEARRDVRDFVDKEAKIRYLGRDTVPLHNDEHYVWDDETCAAAGCWPEVECWWFEEIWP